MIMIRAMMMTIPTTTMAMMIMMMLMMLMIAREMMEVIAARISRFGAAFYCFFRVDRRRWRQQRGWSKAAIFDCII